MANISSKKITLDKIIPVKYHDNGDGTYSIVYWNGATDPSDLISTEKAGTKRVTVRYHNNGDGTYSPVKVVS